MSNRRIRASGTVAVLVPLLLSACAPRPAGPRAQEERAHAVILLVGDGMGDQEITAARNFAYGASGRLHLDSLPVRGWSLTASVQEAFPHLPDYVVDSAASATAWATGKRTSNGRLSTTAGSSEPLPTVLERAQEAGMPVGVVTTSDVTDATPAALFAHVELRLCQGPADLRFCPRARRENGGPGSIAEQAVERRLDVLMGGGRKKFEQRIEAGPWRGQTLLEVVQERGDTLLREAAELGSLDRNARHVIGLFAESDFSPQWDGEPARPFPGSGPQHCVPGQRPAEQPSLPQMTEVALMLLHRWAAERGTPFFLQVEGANIDKSAHAAEPCEQIGETLELDDTVAVVLRYAAANPGTLVILTADHAHATQIVPFPGERARPPGLLSTLVTREGALLTLSYPTQIVGGAQTHTGSQVPILASGPFAQRLAGTHAQTELYRVMSAALGLPD